MVFAVGTCRSISAATAAGEVPGSTLTRTRETIPSGIVSGFTAFFPDSPAITWASSNRMKTELSTPVPVRSSCPTT